ncbi:phosphodiester glycosidase family protein [Streptomyces sp. NPDC050504]|uniref:phosphodiester glycosidase family protein n=1 Tax=Streptomyces sp. NPDC050504 TaxID=3365618 RepID=UPI0037BC3F66
MVVWCALLGLGATPSAGAVGRVRVAPGVEYRVYDVAASRGAARVHVLSVDLRDPRVRVGLLHPGAVAARAPVSALVVGGGAVAGVNGDFFNITETQHPGVQATGAPVGPAIAEGRALKAAVPDGQRFGPALPPTTSTRDVFGVGYDRRARQGSLALEGTVTTPSGRLPLGGLNQYALPVGSVGAFTADWGAVSRQRAVCGTDTDRAAPCTDEAFEVTVRRGRVVSTSNAPGAGPIARDTTVLVGREAGAARLRGLAVGERVSVGHRLVPSAPGPRFRFAVGGYPLLRAGVPLPGLDARTAAVRSAVGSAEGGRRLLLLVLDGAPEFRTGLTIAEVADEFVKLGADEGFSLDGGGSSTLVAPGADGGGPQVLNHPSGGSERPVPNGIGVF